MKIAFDPDTGHVSVATELSSGRQQGVQEFLATLREEDPQAYKAVVQQAESLMDRLAGAVMSAGSGLSALDGLMATLGFDELTGSHLVEAALWIPSAQYSRNKPKARRRRK